MACKVGLPFPAQGPSLLYHSSHAHFYNSNIIVSVGFFKNMWVSLVHLPQPCALYISFFLSPLSSLLLSCNHTAHSFLWMHNAATPTNARISGCQAPKQHQPTHKLLNPPETERLYIDQGEIVRVRVERDEFCDDKPGPQKATEGVLISRQCRLGVYPMRWL